MSEVLRAMAGSADLDRVSQMIVDAAARLCSASSCRLMRREGDSWVYAAQYGTSAIAMDLGSRLVPTTETVWGRAALDGTISNIADTMTADPPLPNPSQSRTRMAVPVLRGDSPIAVLVTNREEPGGFTQREEELLVTFADQAAIAIENARLFNETKEALERQTAISEILRVIAASPTDITPVLEAIAENALRFCSAEDALVMLPEGDGLRLAAHRGPIPVAGDLRYPNDGTSMNSRAFLDRKTIAVEDLQTSTDFPAGAEHARAAGSHASIVSPLLRDSVAVGTIALRRFDARRFSSGEISALETFAAQAVVAIENARLFAETKTALERQTALSEILQTIAASPTDQAPVLDAVVRNAVRFCGGEDALLLLLSAGEFSARAHFGPIPTRGSEANWTVDRDTVIGHAVVDRMTVQSPDVKNDPDHPLSREAGARLEFGAVIATPLLRDGVSIGGLALRRLKPGAFSAEEEELLRAFAAQAVIAIENVRLFNETKEALERQTATAELLKVISR
ncbi:MAG TPA: GAF domain-containing protein, partial [Candidatus Saccharimonadales bacterium]|nr:GAF domain-containing protein [Candidatus Saccharimonadales bacterium]